MIFISREIIENINFRDTASYKLAVSLLHNINADKTFKELPPYKNDTLPFNVWTDIYKYLIDNTVNCHWHNDFEYGVLLEGKVDYYINDTQISLEKGDVVFINSNILHMSKQSINSEDAVMYTFTFPASLLSENINSIIYKKYIKPLLNTQIEGFKILNENSNGWDIKTLLMKIYTLEPLAFGYELECLEYLNKLWLTTLKYIEENKSNLFYLTRNLRNSERMKELLSYIHEHYNEKITASDIANHVSISRGECFRCFKNFMNKSLVEYINEYRLQRAAKLLRETEKNVIDISAECGFENASYFSKIFKQAYSMSPMQYRRAQIWTNNTIKNINNYIYEYWKDSGNGTMIITANANNGSFTCEWSNVNNIVFRSGKRFNYFEKTHKELGNISLQYDAAFNSRGNSYICVYGWSIDPLIEWYIVECYKAYNPADNLTCIGTHDINGGTYELYQTVRKNQPSIIGVANFKQYWSIRTSGRFGGVVNVSAHLRAWEKNELKTGRISEIALSIEGWRSSGNASVNTNILTIDNGDS